MTISEAFQIAVQRHQAGRLADAEALYRQILAAQPNHAEALHLLGLIAHQVGRDDLAVEWIRQAIVLDPSNSAAHSNLGEACRKIGRLDDAITAFRRALQLQPDSPETHNNLGNALRAQGQSGEAVAAYRRALQFKPDSPEVHNNLAIALKTQGYIDEAIVEYRRALELKPDSPEAHNNLAIALRKRGLIDEAAAASRRALELKPDCAEAHNSLGNALREQGQASAAVASYCRALELKPDYLEAHNNLGNALKDQGRIEEAAAAYRRALELNPEQAWVHSNLIYTLHFHPAHNTRTIAAERERWNRQFSAPLKPILQAHANHPAVTRRLRIGYVSPDFRDHPVGRYMLPLFRGHDPGRFEIFCYSGVVHPDPLTAEIRSHAQQWRSTIGLGDEALAESIRRDGVDILVDLTQHMADNRLPLFARKPAPIQVSFAGYPESAGLEAIEYRISDRYLEAGSLDEGAGTKERVCLIDSFWCYDPGGTEVEVKSPPGLENGAVTFGCLNNFCKVNEQVLNLWARVLGQVKDSRLLLFSPAGSHRERTLEAFDRNGVAPRRVEFVDFHPWREYLELYHRLDIVLDTFPYNGGMTACDALWMGVPVVSLAGETRVSRMGLSLLTNLGLPELAARSETEYLDIAERLARDLPRLAELRSNLRQRMENSVLMDAPHFTRQVEQTYRKMWTAWCEMHSPTPE